MEKAKLLVIAAVNLLFLLGISEAIESPQYTVVHKESDFEVRLYNESKWMSALVRELSFQKATMFGFHRLFQYIEGANLNFSRIPMTAPVLTSIVPGAGPLHSSAYSIRLYLPVDFQDSPPVPLRELKLKPRSWDSRCIAVRKFSGFAKDDNIVREAEKLNVSLSRSPWANATSNSTNAYSIAQYDSPFQFFGRVNEVWFRIAASGLNGCESGGIAWY